MPKIKTNRGAAKRFGKTGSPPSASVACVSRPWFTPAMSAASAA